MRNPFGFQEWNGEWSDIQKICQKHPDFIKYFIITGTMAAVFNGFIDLLRD
jgi:hypothetical protein